MKAYFGSSSDSDTPAAAMGGRKWEGSGSLAAAWPPPGRGPSPYSDRLRLLFSNRNCQLFFVAHAPGPDDPTPTDSSNPRKTNPTDRASLPYIVAERGSCRRVDFMRSPLIDIGTNRSGLFVIRRGGDERPRPSSLTSKRSHPKHKIIEFIKMRMNETGWDGKAGGCGTSFLSHAIELCWMLIGKQQLPWLTKQQAARPGQVTSVICS